MPRTASPALPTVLLTGFDAFGGDSINPSGMAVSALDGEVLQGHRVVTAQLPTVFATSLPELKRLIRLHRPALVICVGQAGGRAALSLERVAINVNDARIADNDGAQPLDVPVITGGPAAYFTRLPIKAMLGAMQKSGLAAEVSQTAGTFVCNHVFYGLMHTLARQRADVRARGGFIHVPWLPEQGQPAMALDDIVKGLRVAVKTALVTTHDAATGGGAIS